MTLSYPSGLTINGVDFATIAQSVQASLAQIGITISLQALPVVTFLTDASAGKLDMLGVYTTINYPDPSSILKFLPGPASTNAQASDVGWTTGADPTIQNLAIQASSTLNRAQRGKLFQKVGRLLDTSGPWVSFFQSAQAIVGSSNLTNLVLNPAWGLNLAAVGSK
jgi:peptide/nickel transport system substrate-binding protein